MEVKSSVGLAVGPANANQWGQVLVTPTGYGIVEIEDPQGHAQQLGIAALSFISEKISHSISSLSALEDIADQVAPQGLKTLVLLVSVGKVVYIVLRGHGSVYVKRGGELAGLMRENGGISGEVKVNDTFLLVSKGFSDILPHEELSKLFDHLSVPEVAEKLTIILHEHTGGEGMVALVFGITEFFEHELNDPAPLMPSPRVQHVSMLGKLHAIPDFIQYIRQHPKERLRMFAILAGVFFIISVALGIWKQGATKKNIQLTVAIEDAQHSLDEGVALTGLNPLKSRERLTLAKDTLAPFVQTVAPKSLEGQRVLLLYQQITDNLTQAMQIVTSPVTLFYDVTLLKKGASVSDMALYGDTLALADKTTQTLFTVLVPTKSAQIVGGGASLKSILSVGIHGDTMYALTPEGINAFDTVAKKSSLIVKKDASWGFVTSLVSFGGNIYVLDTQNSRIWKYVATDAGMSEMREYLNPDTLPDLSLTTGMAIDGSVWLGTSDGKIFRFTQGKDNPFNSQGVEPEFGKHLVVYTRDDVQNMYVLDTQNHRVVVLDKTGMYLSQYQFDGKVTPTKLVVSESAKKILLLADGKIFALDLK